MAAPTNVRVESNSLTTATIRWTYTGTAPIAVFRSTDGVSYSEITVESFTRVLSGTTLYIDADLEVGTKYWYKLSDDGGGTFSSVVTVVTQSCLPPAGSLDTFSLPTFPTPDPIEEFKVEEGLVVMKDWAVETASAVNNLAERVENILGGRLLAPDVCIVCPTDGAIVLNCAGHCREWIIIADEDINSISVQYCDEGDGTIEFLIPPNVTRRITGWPDGFGASGDEPAVVTGSNGRTMSVPSSRTGGKAKPTSSRPGTGSGIGSGGGSGAGACGCSAVSGNLTIKSCNANNSLNCYTTKSLKLLACGGRAPYTWSNTGSVTLSSTTGPTTTVTPPANPGSGTAGTAYELKANVQEVSLGLCVSKSCIEELGCNDQSISTLGVGGGVNGCRNCSGSFPAIQNGVCGSEACSNCAPANCLQDTNRGTINCQPRSDPNCMSDVRTAPMIAAGCVPCGVSHGATVTVTDSIGTQTTIILRN